MGATITKGKTFSNTETVTNTKLHNLVDNATITKVTDADNDTKIDLEESSDEDIIRFDTAGIERVTIQAGKIEPTTDDNIDLGTSSKEFKDLRIDGKAYIDGLGEDILVDLDKKVQFGDTAVHIQSDDDGHLDLTADTSVDFIIGSTEQFELVDGAILPTTDDDVDLGASGKEFKDLYIDGTANIDTLVLGTLTITSDTLAKAWINFNGTSGDFGTATRDSFNVSSITDGGVGIYNINWDTDFANVNYCTLLSTREGTTGSGYTQLLADPVAGSIQMGCQVGSTGAAQDSAFVFAFGIGDQ